MQFVRARSESGSSTLRWEKKTVRELLDGSFQERRCVAGWVWINMRLRRRMFGTTGLSRCRGSLLLAARWVTTALQQTSAGRVAAPSHVGRRVDWVYNNVNNRQYKL